MSLRRTYETTFIVNAALEDPDIDSIISKVTGYIENHGAQILEINRWGRRRLAYPINKKYNGFYVHIVFDASPSTIPILERFLVLEDTVLRHLTLILPKKLRDFRAKRALEGTNMFAPANPEAEGVGNRQGGAKSYRRSNFRDNPLPPMVQAPEAAAEEESTDNQSEA